MTLPDNKDPLGWTLDGKPFPLILAPSLVDEARKRFPRLWIEPNRPIPLQGF